MTAGVRQVLFGIVRRERLAAGIALAVFVLAGVNWLQAPAEAHRWVRLMLVPPAIILAMTCWLVWSRRADATAGDWSARQRYFHDALTLFVVAAGLPLMARAIVALWLRSGDQAADVETGRRLLGLSLAGAFFVAGNTLPKILTPLSMLPVRLAERQTRARRALGTLLVALAIVMAIGFVAVPVSLARTIADWSRVAAIAGVVAAIVWMNMAPVRDRS